MIHNIAKRNDAAVIAWLAQKKDVASTKMIR